MNSIEKTDNTKQSKYLDVYIVKTRFRVEKNLYQHLNYMLKYVRYRTISQVALSLSIFHCCANKLSSYYPLIPKIVRLTFYMEIKFEIIMI